MLMTVLKGEQATAQSKALIRLFKQMKDYIAAENKQLLGNDGIAQIALQTAQIRGISRNILPVLGNFLVKSMICVKTSER